MAPLVSVCLPVYNGEKYLAQAIESVLHQSFANFELIIVDDASSDNSLEIIQAFAATDKRIRWSRNQETQGLFANYNFCMGMATGTIIKLFAQDDILYAKMLERVVDVLLKNPEVSLVSTRRRWINAEGLDVTSKCGITSASDYCPAGLAVESDEIINSALLNYDNFIGEPSAVAFAASSVGAGFNLKFHQLGDLEYWLRILSNGQYFFIDETLCDFRSHEDSSSTANNRRMLHAVDSFALGQIYRERIAASGKSEYDYVDNLVAALSFNLPEGMGSEELSRELMRQAEAVAPDSFKRLDEADVQVFRELAFYALMHAKKFPEGHRHFDRATRRQIHFLERRLQLLLRSPSWRSTTWLRMGRRFLLAQLSEDDFCKIEGSPAYGEDYIKYLRKEIYRLRRSRSWKLTRSLRALEFSFDGRSEQK